MGEELWVMFENEQELAVMLQGGHYRWKTGRYDIGTSSVCCPARRTADSSCRCSHWLTACLCYAGTSTEPSFQRHCLR